MQTPNLYAGLSRDNALKTELIAAFPDLAENDKALIDTLDGISDLDEQIATTMRAALEREAVAEALVQMIDRMADRHTRLVEGGQKLRRIVAQIMTDSGRRRIEKPDFTLSLRAGRISYLVVEVEELPADLVVLKKRPNMMEINRRKKVGEKIPGVVTRNGAPYVTVSQK